MAYLRGTKRRRQSKPTYKEAMVLKKMIMPMKHHRVETVSTALNIGTMAYESTIETLAHGDNNNQRLDDKIWLGGVKHDLYVHNDITGAKPTFLRVVVALDKSPAEGQAYDFFKFTGTTSTDAAGDYSTSASMHKLDMPINNRRYLVLFDKVYPVGHADAPESLYRHISIPFLRINKLLSFSDTGTTSKPLYNPVIYYFGQNMNNDASKTLHIKHSATYFFKDA